MRAPFKPKNPADIQKLAKLARSGMVEGDHGFEATATDITFLMYRTKGDGHADYVIDRDRRQLDQAQLRMPWRRFLSLQGRAPADWNGPAPLLLQGAFLLTMSWTSTDGFHDDAVSRLAATCDV